MVPYSYIIYIYTHTIYIYTMYTSYGALYHTIHACVYVYTPYISARVPSRVASNCALIALCAFLCFLFVSLLDYISFPQQNCAGCSTCTTQFRRPCTEGRSMPFQTYSGLQHTPLLSSAVQPQCRCCPSGGSRKGATADKLPRLWCLHHGLCALPSPARGE